MFEINQQNIPFVRTRRALIALDLQNDFIAFGGLLPVENPPHFLDKILELVPKFRDSGNDIIWIWSQFEASRPINEAHGDSESVITDEQLLPVHRKSGERVSQKPSQRLLELQSRIALSNGRALQPSTGLEADDGIDVNQIEETYLTISQGQTPRVVVSSSPGRQFSNAVRLAVDSEKDLIYPKSYYSAFRDGNLVQVLRSRFITEIYLVGCLTNISVFATAMDAARHGYAITIIEDGLGYRSKARHDEALRKLTEFTGCDIVQSKDVVAGLQPKVPTMPPQRNPRRRENGDNLEALMANLDLKSESPSNAKAPANATEVPRVAVAEAAGSSESLATSDSLPEKKDAGDGKKRERVISKVKIRRRHSPKETKSSANEKRDNSPTSTRLLRVSEALASMPKREDPESAVPPPANGLDESEASDISYTERLYTEIGSSDGIDSKHSRHDTPASSHEKHVEHPATICEGDTTVIDNLLEEDLAEGIFEKLRDEVRWQKMTHLGGDVPRLVAVQGEISEDGSIAVYRHPADESPPLLPFSPTVSLIQAKVEETLGHSVNHVLIQFYRDGTDYISEHSDKTLDIVPKTYIANVSLGAQRTMVFRTKRQPKNENDPNESEIPKARHVCRAPLPHNSMCKMGLATNMKWLHGIRQDKRMASEKSAEELAFDGGRISLTFRQIGTFLNKDQTRIWGQGATSKSKAGARTVVNGETAEFDRMLKAFGKENQSSEFNWADSYGQGFDVLHMSNSPKLYLSGNDVSDMRVKLSLAYWNISWTEGKLSPSFKWKDGGSSNRGVPGPEHLPVTFVDNDLSRSTITGDLAIMLYLDTIYGRKSETKSPIDLARQFTRLQESGELPFSEKPLKGQLELWNAHAGEAAFVAGSKISIVDFALWPILHKIAKEWPDLGGLENLKNYYMAMKKQDCVIKAAALENGETIKDKSSQEQ